MKIVYFDYWTKGIANFIDIDKQLKSQGHDTQLFHIGSFRSEVPKSEVVADIMCTDISAFNTSLIFKALSEINPDVVVTLNTTYLLDRAVVLACRQLDIKTVFLMHGTRATGVNISKAIETAERSYNSIWKKLRKSLKYIKLVIPNYIYTLYMHDKKKVLSCYFIKVIYAYFKSPGKAMYAPDYPDELIHDKCLVYAKDYIEYYKNLGYAAAQITVTGNPKQDKLLERIHKKQFSKDSFSSEVFCHLKEMPKYAVYLEDSFVESGNMYGWDNVYRNRHLTQIAERLKKDDTVLVIKLHPATSINDIEISSDNAVVVEQTDLDSLIFYCEYCIAHISTTVNIPVLLEKPVLVPKWERSALVIDYYTDNNVAAPWLDINNRVVLSIDKAARSAFIDRYISVTKPVAMKNILKEILI